LIQALPARISGTVTIPSSVKSIGVSAFVSCNSLTGITIPSGVTSIGASAFSGTGLTSVIIPASVTTIGDSAFYNVANLTSVTLGGSGVNIGENAFVSTGNNLRTAYLAGGPGTYTRSGSAWSKHTITFSNVTANGNATTTTTQLTLTFNQAITGLTADDITLNNMPGIIKGTLSASGSTYTLPISGFVSSGSLYVFVSKPGYNISPEDREVDIYYYYNYTGPTTKYDGTYDGTLMNNADYSEYALDGIAFYGNDSIRGGNIIIPDVSIGSDNTVAQAGFTGTWAYVYSDSGSRKIGIVYELTVNGTVNRCLALGKTIVDSRITLWSSYGFNPITSDMDNDYSGLLDKQ